MKLKGILGGLKWGGWLASLMALAGVAQAQTVVKYVHTDALGSVVAITDQNRVVIERREYEPYGQQLAPAVQDGPGYTGHVQDAATGLTYMQQRYYDSGIGAMLSVDPVTAYEQPITNFCRYCYARNNPYRFTDPDGRDGMESVFLETETWGVYSRVMSRATGDGASYSSNREAHRGALGHANPRSVRENREYGGKTYKTSDNRYGYTPPAPGTDQGFNPSNVTVPSGTTETGGYHTHGDYSVADPATGAAIRTSDPNRDSFNSDNFSPQDLRGIRNDAAGKSEYSGSLGTPSGKAVRI